MNVLLSVLYMLIFLAVMVYSSKEGKDYASFSLILALFVSAVTAVTFDMSFSGFLDMIEFSPILFIFSMQVLVSITEENGLFQWLALKTLHAVKGDYRKFYYLICVLSFVSAGVLADITVAIILAPLAIRAAKILRIDPTPYLFGIAFSINVGSAYTPFSSSENVLIANSFHLSFLWFMRDLTIYVLPALVFTIVLIDFTHLRKISQPDELQRQLMLEILKPGIVIKDRRKFIMNSIYFITVLIIFILSPSEVIPVLALFFAILLCLINGTPLSDVLRRIDLKIIFFFIALFLLIGSMEIVGIFEFLGEQLSHVLGSNVLLAAIIVLISVSLLSGFLAQVPTTLVYITLLSSIFGGLSHVPTLVTISLLLGVNLGASFLPQGAASNWMILNLARESNIEGFTFEEFIHTGSRLTAERIALCSGLLVIFSFFV